MTYEEAEKLYGRKARFVEWNPRDAFTVRPPREDEILSEDERRDEPASRDDDTGT